MCGQRSVVSVAPSRWNRATTARSLANRPWTTLIASSRFDAEVARPVDRAEPARGDASFDQELAVEHRADQRIDPVDHRAIVVLVTGQGADQCSVAARSAAAASYPQGE